MAREGKWRVGYEARKQVVQTPPCQNYEFVKCPANKELYKLLRSHNKFSVFLFLRWTVGNLNVAKQLEISIENSIVML